MTDDTLREMIASELEEWKRDIHLHIADPDEGVIPITACDLADRILALVSASGPVMPENMPEEAYIAITKAQQKGQSTLRIYDYLRAALLAEQKD